MGVEKHIDHIRSRPAQDRLPFAEERSGIGVLLGHKGKRAPGTLHHPIGIFDQSPCNSFVQG
jgi:hypothetical protein